MYQKYNSIFDLKTKRILKGFHFSFSFSKFVLLWNQKTNYTFGTRIEENYLNFVFHIEVKIKSNQKIFEFRFEIYQKHEVTLDHARINFLKRQLLIGVLWKKCSWKFRKIHSKISVLETQAQVFSCEICEIFQSSFSIENLWIVGSVFSVTGFWFR